MLDILKWLGATLWDIVVGGGGGRGGFGRYSAHIFLGDGRPKNLFSAILKFCDGILGSWDPGILGSWDPGIRILGSWDSGILGSWDWILGSWDLGILGSWDRDPGILGFDFRIPGSQDPRIPRAGSRFCRDPGILGSGAAASSILVES